MACKLPLQFVPFCSSISSSFWDSFTKLKLNDLKLNTDPVQVHGYYSRRIIEGIPPLLELQHQSFEGCDKSLSNEVAVSGTLINTNTVEEFKGNDKTAMLGRVAYPIWKAIVSGYAEANPSILSSFLIYIFADLKKYHFYHWLACPVFTLSSSVQLHSEIQTLDVRIPDEKMVRLLHATVQKYEGDLNFFTLHILDDAVHILPLSSYYELRLREKEDFEVMLGFSDPCNDRNHPGWPLRNLLTLAVVRWSKITKHTILSLREKITSGISSINQSLVFDVVIENNQVEFTEIPQVLGWERNERQKLGPKFTNLRSSMEPDRIAETAVELNLKLMRWRLVPDLDLTTIRCCRCLLIGAGTLGCNVARCLLGWGVQNITFVDCGIVSYSNPVRQSLYVFEDCLAEGKPKAEVAAMALKRIYPRVNAEGVNLTIPMPGHSVGPSQMDSVSKDISRLEELVDKHDAIFLLTDSRESRWLLSTLGTAKQKIVLTAALGFDSFVVMRHGIHATESQQNLPEISQTLGCYFCNDVVAPGNSVSDRTLDQQCTVTRPGISYMAAGHIVELLISLLHHPLRGGAPAAEEDDSTILGAVPHSIRYYLSRLHILITSTIAFKNCSACGPQVVNAYKENGVDFFFKVFNSTQYLEDVSGLTTLHEESQGMELWEMSESEESS